MLPEITSSINLSDPITTNINMRQNGGHTQSSKIRIIKNLYVTVNCNDLKYSRCVNKRK